MPPIVSIIGRSATGKTTLIENLVRELSSRGYRVATVKHVPRHLSFDHPEKDSWRHMQAGSQATAISAPDRLVIIRPTTEPPSLEQVARYIGEDYDLIIAEGFKGAGAPKIEVHRQEIGPPLTNIKKRIAIVTDDALNIKTRLFSPNDINGLADLLEQGFIQPQRQRTILYVNNNPVPLISFPKKILGNVIMGMLASLKGIENVTSVEIVLRREPM